MTAQHTPSPLTPEREQEIRESIPTAYSPPWTVFPDMDDDVWRVMYATDHQLAGLVAEVPDYGAHLAEFIATARAAVPELLAEIGRLRDELAPPKKAKKSVQRDYEPAVVRAWAKENSVDCPASGRVPKAVVEQWRQATGSQAG